MSLEVPGLGEEPAACDLPRESLADTKSEEVDERQMPPVQDRDKKVQWNVGREHDMCYRLQPSVVAQGKKNKKSSNTTACCQPQSLIYARCRSGIVSCKLGDTSPTQWFSCAAKMGNTTDIPAPNAVLVLGADARRKIFTGHPLYVEQARKKADGTWSLRISHTNYDRKCSLDQNADVTYDPAKRTVSFHSGPWACWAQGQKTLGFILR